MAIGATLLTSNYDNTIDTSSPYTRTTASISPAANSLLIVFVADTETSLADSGAAAVTGLSLSWTKREELGAASGQYAISAHTAQCGASPGSGALTITFTVTGTGTTGTGWAVIEVTGHNTASPVVQHPSATAGSGTTATVSLSAAGNSQNRPFAYSFHAANTATSPRASWTELNDNAGTSPNFGSEAQWRSDAFETTATSTWTTSSEWLIVALEIAAATGGAPAPYQARTPWLRNR